MAQSAFSDKLQALQARDKALRESRQRQTDIETATAVTGCCPDMCPEMERLFRTETNQLSALEMSDGFADPDAMVKEYRRAGADQSEPLPHELRPGPILSRTMDYLLCNVMDRVAETGPVRNEWYDFLWSRTRAIRKDITQQHLCDTRSVDLMEKCTRFHIHCSAALVEEETTVFDPKINDENLRKCMQSLKDFYHDLSVSQGILCPNESEFRAYDILMNLADSDILREIKHLRKDIIDSTAVKFAIDSFFALSSNNYIKFFRLVRSTTYLNACLLHRFFPHVRLQAVRLLRRAVTTPKSAHWYPADDFMRQLGFDDDKQLSIFCSSLSLPYDSGAIQLSRDDGEFRDTPTVPPLRSQSLVESKRDCSVGQVVNGGPLPENPFRKFPVHSSFDGDGNLKPNALAGVSPEKLTSPIDLRSSLTSPPEPQPASQTQPVFSFGAASALPASATTGFSFLRQAQLIQPEPAIQEPEPVQISETEKAQTVERLAEDMIDEAASGIVASCVKLAYTQMMQKREFDEKVQTLYQCVVRDTLDTTIREIASSEYEKELEIKQAADFRRNVIEVSKDILESVLNQAVAEGARDAASAVIKSAQEDMFLRISRDLSEELVQEAIVLRMKQVAKAAIREATEKRERMIQRMLEHRKKKLTIKYFRMWLIFYRKKKKFNELRQTFPASCLESGKGTEICIPVDLGKKRTLERVSSDKRKKKQRMTSSPATPVTRQLRRSPRTNDPLAKAREDIRMAGDMTPNGKLNLLTSKLNEEKQNGIRCDQIVATVTRALAHTEESYL